MRRIAKDRFHRLQAHDVVELALALGENIKSEALAFGGENMANGFVEIALLAVGVTFGLGEAMLDFPDDLALSIDQNLRIMPSVPGTQDDVFILARHSFVQEPLD